MKQPEANAVEVYLQGLSARNMRTSLEALDLMAQRLTWETGPKGGKRTYDGLTAPWWLLTSEKVVALRAALVNGEWISENTGEPFTPTAVNRFLAALRGVMRQCWLQGRMPVAAYLDSVAKLKSVSPVPSRAARD